MALVDAGVRKGEKSVRATHLLSARRLSREIQTRTNSLTTCTRLTNFNSRDLDLPDDEQGEGSHIWKIKFSEDGVLLAIKRWKTLEMWKVSGQCHPVKIK